MIEKILKRALAEDGSVLLQVKWKGFDEHTWEPRDTLMEDVPEMVKKFEAKRPRGRPRKVPQDVTATLLGRDGQNRVDTLLGEC